MNIEKASLFVPELEEISEVLQKGLCGNFENVQVNVVDCPDLSEKPFMLADKGLSGSPRLADVGGVPNLIPLVNLDKRYNLETVAKQVDLPGGFLIGAGAGAHHLQGTNCEMVANIKTGKELQNKTHFVKVNTLDNSMELVKANTSDFCLMANLFCSEGKTGKVLEVKASKRTGVENYMTCIRKVLAEHYGGKPVGLGGIFLVEKGKAKLHVMPHFSKEPLSTDDKVSEWLKYYEEDAPLICLGVLISSDPGLDLRIEHFHCFSDHGVGGHYHYDTTPDDVEYRGYFNVAEYMYRIDRPKETHQIGRD